MDIASSGAFRPQARGGVIAMVALASAITCGLGYVGWKRWLHVPSVSSVCERVDDWAESEPGARSGFESSVFSALEVGDGKSRGDTFHDRCTWFFETMQDVDSSFYGDVARCIDAADDSSAAIACTYSSL